MKIGVVGSGMVGATAAYAMVMRGVGRTIVLVDLDKKRAQAEADDILHAVPFAHTLRVISGDYSDLNGCSVIVIAAGANQKPGETRLDLLKRNADIFHQIIPQILENAPQAILLVSTNPVDVMTYLTAHFASEFHVPSSRIIGTGTTLDTARFRTLLGRSLEIDPRHIHAYVIGEHGDSEVLTWSLVTIGGIPLEEFCKTQGTSLCVHDKVKIEDSVRNAAYHIIEGKRATYYGVGAAIAHITHAILRDQHSIMTICTPLKEVAGVKDVVVSLPNLVGSKGVLATFPPPLDEQESADFQSSARIIRDAIDAIGINS